LLATSNTSSGQLHKTGDAVVYNPDGDGLYDTADVSRSAPLIPGILVARHHDASPRAQQVVSLTWDPGSLREGTTTIFGAAAPSWRVRSDQQRRILSNNFLQKFKGDVSGDCKVDIIDLSTVRSSLGSSVGGAEYKANADLNNDHTINIHRLVLVAGSFGQTAKKGSGTIDPSRNGIKTAAPRKGDLLSDRTTFFSLILLKVHVNAIDADFYRGNLIRYSISKLQIPETKAIFSENRS